MQKHHMVYIQMYGHFNMNAEKQCSFFKELNRVCLSFIAIKQEDEDSGSNKVGAIIGGIFGGIGFIVLVFIIYKVVQRNRYK